MSDNGLLVSLTAGPPSAGSTQMSWFPLLVGMKRNPTPVGRDPRRVVRLPAGRQLSHLGAVHRDRPQITAPTAVRTDDELTIWSGGRAPRRVPRRMSTGRHLPSGPRGP